MDSHDGARILIACHAPGPVPEGPHLTAIHVGRAGAGAPLPGMIGDDTGDHISDLNPEYCELTAQYWAWKNLAGTGPVGLMHYRRLFDFSPRPGRAADRFLPGFDEDTWRRDMAGRMRDLRGPLLIVGRPARLSLPLGLHYRAFHHAGDLAALRAVVDAHHPGFAPDLTRALRGRGLIMGNMFIMSRPVFDHYSALLFDILGRTRDRLGARADEGYQRRWLGFLAERVMTAYVMGQYRARAFPELAPEFRPILNIDPKAPARAGGLRLARYCLQGRIAPGDAWQAWRGEGA